MGRNFKRCVPTALGWLVGGVWIFHGLYSKVLDGIPRHRQIVARILGEEFAAPSTIAIGAVEVALGLWVLIRKWPRCCAGVQTLAIAFMNTLEIRHASDLLISPAGMLALNIAFLAMAWWVAVRTPDQRIQPD